MISTPEINHVLDCQESWNLFGPLEPAAVEAELTRGAVTGSLSGRTVGLKANIAVAGAIWSAGLAHRNKIKATRDSNVTSRLRQEGAVLLSGLNMDAAALGGATDNPDFGRTDNPRAPGYCAGGSSGGSAAAVAAGLINLALGTDTMGSIRIPAAYCGVYGLKPTFGLVGRSGIVPLAPSLDVVGPISATATDLWPVLKAIVGPDEKDIDNIIAPKGWSDETPGSDLRGTVIGVPTQIDDVDCEPEILEAFERSLSSLRDMGAQIVKVDMRCWVPARLRKAAFLLSECEGAVSHAGSLAVPGTLPADVEELLAYGRDLSSGRLIAALSEVRAAGSELRSVLNDIDLLAMPTTPQRAFPAKIKPPANQADFTVLANASGTPALAVPVPTRGLPCSVQLMGPAFLESRLISVAMALEENWQV